MTQDHIQPFVDALLRTFRTMLNIEPVPGRIREGKGIEVIHDVSGIVGLTGEGGNGAVVLSFPKEVALKAVSRFVGEDQTDLNQDVVDGIGELANIIAGNAKGELREFGLKGLSMSMPAVVVGARHKVFNVKDAESIAVPFTSEIGPISLQVYLKLA